MSAARADEFDLGGLRLGVGEGRRIELSVPLEPLELGGERYEIEPERVPVQLEVSRMTGSGYALRLRLHAALTGQCMRCLKAASPRVEVEAREVDRPGGGEELESPYVDGEKLDLAAWARDAFARTHAELPLDIAARRIRLGEVETVGGAAEVEFFGDGDEVTEVT